MDLKPSKLSSAATRVWEESAGQFHKKADLNIDLGLRNTISSISNSTTITAVPAEKPSSSLSSGYVFGSRVFERVAKTAETSSSSASNDVTNDNKTNDTAQQKPLDVSSIFRRMAQKAAGSSEAAAANGSDPISLWKGTGASKNGDGHVLLSKDKLSESANELANKQQQKGAGIADSEEQDPITTGEEEEHHLLQISCKFYQYNTESKQWQERGMGTLRLNQHIDAKDDVRLVGRQSGSQRVLINSKIFPEMLLEELSEKRIKISAHVGESDVPQLFLIQSSPASIASLQTLLRIYIDSSHCMKAAQSEMAMTNLATRKRRLTDEPIEEEDDEDEEGASFEERREGAKKMVKQGGTEEMAQQKKEEEGEEEREMSKKEEEERGNDEKEEEEEEKGDEDDEKKKDEAGEVEERE